MLKMVLLFFLKLISKKNGAMLAWWKYKPYISMNMQLASVVSYEALNYLLHPKT